MIFFFFFNDTATTEIYTLSLHDALPISKASREFALLAVSSIRFGRTCWTTRSKPCRGRASCGCGPRDRKSTRLNSSHGYISYAVFCLKKKKKQKVQDR